MYIDIHSPKILVITEEELLTEMELQSYYSPQRIIFLKEVLIGLINLYFGNKEFTLQKTNVFQETYHEVLFLAGSLVAKGKIKYKDYGYVIVENYERR